jgi:hypothetical protein
VPGRRGTALERFWSKVDVGSGGGCWTWTGARSKTGYGSFNVGDGVWRSAHRFSYEIHVGTIPDGLALDHLCRETSCVNPLHLEPVTHHENIRRGVTPVQFHQRATRCHRGHALPENGYYRDGGNGPLVYCKACRREDYAALPPDELERVRAACRERVARIAARKKAA